MSFSISLNVEKLSRSDQFMGGWMIAVVGGILETTETNRQFQFYYVRLEDLVHISKRERI